MTSHVQKEPRRKPKYGLLSCVVYIYRILWKYERRLAFVGIVTVPISLCLAALALYLPSEIISVLETSDRFSYIALVIAGLLLAKLLLDTVHSIINTKISYSEHYVLSRLRDIRRTRKYDRDWYLRYDPEVDKMDDRALEALQNSRSSGDDYSDSEIFVVWISNLALAPGYHPVVSSWNSNQCLDEPLATK